METEKYGVQRKRLPAQGRQVIGYRQKDTITVYQAFNPAIVSYAVAQQQFGGAQYSFNRMSWIKPGFLWMMHRAGWATKENQQRIVAVSLPVVRFKEILQQATISAYDARFFAHQAAWKAELAATGARLQWDPDHDPLGNKQARKAIQLGMKGSLLKQFCTEWIVKIEDITGFVQQQYTKLQRGAVDDLDLPYEEIIDLQDEALEKKIGIEKPLNT